jgi:hypothetical protein
MTIATDYVEVARRQLPGKASWTVVDVFARERGTRGRFPTVTGAITVTLEERLEGGVWRRLGEPLDAEYQRTPSGTLLFSGRALPRRDAAAKVIPPGRYRCRITSDYYQELRLEAELAAGVHRIVELLPGYAYPFPASATLSKDDPPRTLDGLTAVRGALHRFDGAGVAGATVELVEPSSGTFGDYRTDASGQWIVIVPGDVSFPVPPPGATAQMLEGTMRITLPNESPFDLAGVTIVRGREVGLAQTAVRGWVQTISGAPIGGGVVVIGGHPGQVTTGPAGEWFYYFGLADSPGQVTITATTRDGATLSQLHPVVERAMTTVPTFRFP